MSKIRSVSMSSGWEKGFRVKLWFRFAAFWLTVMVVGFTISFYVMPYGLLWLAAMAD